MIIVTPNKTFDQLTIDKYGINIREETLKVQWHELQLLKGANSGLHDRGQIDPIEKKSTQDEHYYGHDHITFHEILYGHARIR